MECLLDAGLEPKIYIHAGAIIEVLASQLALSRLRWMYAVELIFSAIYGRCFFFPLRSPFLPLRLKIKIGFGLFLFPRTAGSADVGYSSLLREPQGSRGI